MGLLQLPRYSLYSSVFVDLLALAVTHIVLIFWQDSGVIHRQELVSTLPVLALDVKPDDCVLDMCAAPGSKTLALLDRMHTGLAVSEIPSGILVANDTNILRAMTIAHRSRRARRSPLLLLASDARYLPTLRKRRGYALRYDRILCDVPCSGDGTLRKAGQKEWRGWKVKLGLSLHPLQLRILKRGLQQLKRGGRLVYSTCSMNPIENEAVVAEAIRVCGGLNCFRILPIPKIFLASNDSNGCVPDRDMAWSHNPGSSNWVVPDPNFTSTSPVTYREYSDLPAGRNLVRSMFAPTERTGKLLEEEKLAKALQNCARLLPQHLDGGGFFLALIERCESSETVASTGTTSRTSPLTSVKTVPTQNDGSIHKDVPKSKSIVCVSAGPSCNTMDPSKWRPSQYQRLFPPVPNDLLRCFTDFYGLLGSSEEAVIAGVERFPVEALVMCGKSSSPVITLVSPSLAALYFGGAKFTPLEAGTGLVKMLPTDKHQDTVHTAGDEGSNSDHQVATKKERNSRRESREAALWGLFDEAADLVGHCCTRRKISVSRRDCVSLLSGLRLYLSTTSTSLSTEALSGENVMRLCSGDVGPGLLSVTGVWVPGGVIVKCCVPGDETEDAHKINKDVPLFLCGVVTYVDVGHESMPALELLTDPKLARALKKICFGS